MGTAISNDYKNKTSNETVDAATSIGGTWIGGFAGGALGAKVGTMISPGFGTFIGGLGGAMCGAYYGQSGAEYTKDNIKQADCGKIVSCAKGTIKEADKIAKKYYFMNWFSGSKPEGAQN